MSAADRLFEVRNYFQLGSYQACIKEAQKLTLKTDEEKATRDSFLYRAYVAQGKYSLVLSEIPASGAPPSLAAVRAFAEFLAAPSGKRESILSELAEKVRGGKIPDDDTARVVFANVLVQGNNFDDALRVLAPGNSLECRATAINVLLRIDRPDAAVKELKRMFEVDEDATLSQLSAAHINMAVGRDKLKDAFYIFQEQLDKYGASPLLLTKQAAVLILQQRFEEAEKLLNDAQERDANYAEALINQIVIAERTGKSTEVLNRYIAQMKESHANHPWTVDFVAKETALDRLCSTA